MKIRSARRRKAQLVCESRQPVSGRIFLRTTYDFECLPSTRCEVTGQCPDFRLGQPVFRRVRKSRRATGSMDPLQNFVEGRPDIPDIARFPPAEILAIGRPYIPDDAFLDELRGELRPADMAIADGFPHRRQEVRNPEALQPRSNPGGARFARGLLLHNPAA